MTEVSYSCLACGRAHGPAEVEQRDDEVICLASGARITAVEIRVDDIAPRDLAAAAGQSHDADAVSGD